MNPECPWCSDPGALSPCPDVHLPFRSTPADGAGGSAHEAIEGRVAADAGTRPGHVRAADVTDVVVVLADRVQVLVVQNEESGSTCSTWPRARPGSPSRCSGVRTAGGGSRRPSSAVVAQSADSDGAPHRGHELVQCWVKAAQRVGHVISFGTPKRRSVRESPSVPAFSMSRKWFADKVRLPADRVDRCGSRAVVEAGSCARRTAACPAPPGGRQPRWRLFVRRSPMAGPTSGRSSPTSRPSRDARSPPPARAPSS